MNKGVNVYELMQGFWRENEYEPFPTSAIALFFFLLERANNRRWKMPIKCHTSVISHAISVSRQSVITSRDILASSGMITFYPGKSRNTPASYTIETDSRKWASHLTVDLTDERTVGLTDGLTVKLSEDLSPYNIKEEKIKDQISSIYNAKENKILSLDELERIFLSDTEWHASIISLLSKSHSLTADKLEEQISRFFNQLRCQRIDRREEKDCRTHFFNWIKKQLKEDPNETNKQSDTDRRRGSDVTATSTRDYNGAF